MAKTHIIILNIDLINDHIVMLDDNVTYYNEEIVIPKNTIILYWVNRFVISNWQYEDRIKGSELIEKFVEAVQKIENIKIKYEAHIGQKYDYLIAENGKILHKVKNIERLTKNTKSLEKLKSDFHLLHEEPVRILNEYLEQWSEFFNDDKFYSTYSLSYSLFKPFKDILNQNKMKYRPPFKDKKQLFCLLNKSFGGFLLNAFDSNTLYKNCIISMDIKSAYPYELLTAAFPYEFKEINIPTSSISDLLYIDYDFYIDFINKRKLDCIRDYDKERNIGGEEIERNRYRMNKRLFSVMYNYKMLDIIEVKHLYIASKSDLLPVEFRQLLADNYEKKEHYKKIGDKSTSNKYKFMLQNVYGKTIQKATLLGNVNEVKTDLYPYIGVWVHDNVFARMLETFYKLEFDGLSVKYADTDCFKIQIANDEQIELLKNKYCGHEIGDFELESEKCYSTFLSHGTKCYLYSEDDTLETTTVKFTGTSIDVSKFGDFKNLVRNFINQEKKEYNLKKLKGVI